MKTLKIFIASSSELKEDRDQFRLFISQENDRLHSKGIYLQIVQWENFLDAISDTRLQDEYNNAISQCDIVLCLFFTKVGKYTAEEFDTAYQVFRDKGKPKIWTYFKNAQINTGSITDEINSLLAFKKKIGSLGHFFTEYTNIDNLINKYRTQLDKFLPEYEQGGEKADSAANDNLKSANQESAKIPFNQLMVKRLIEAIRPYNKKANDFLSINPDWEKNSDIIQTVKRIIISGYVGVLGIQLRKLITIGEEDFSDSKVKRYLENCVITAKRSLQLICYAMLSKIWDYRFNNEIHLTQSQTDVLVKFFKNATEDTNKGYAVLLKTLITAFTDNNIEFPFQQLKDLRPILEEGSAFTDACAGLDNVTELLRQSAFASNNCLDAEKQLTVILENLNFLAEFKMISIKDIDYAIQRNDREGSYLHYYTLLEGDSQANNLNLGKVKKEDKPVISYSVLLCKDNLRQNINLDPFIIDYNALGLSGGSKICFFSHCNTYDDLSLNYSFIEDNSKITVKQSKNPRPPENDMQAMNKWLAIPENRKDMNFDNAFKLFHEAKKILAGIEEKTSDDTF